MPGARDPPTPLTGVFGEDTLPPLAEAPFAASGIGAWAEGWDGPPSSIESPSARETGSTFRLGLRGMLLRGQEAEPPVEYKVGRGLVHPDLFGQDVPAQEHRGDPVGGIGLAAR